MGKKMAQSDKRITEPNQPNQHNQPAKPSSSNGPQENDSKSGGIWKDDRFKHLLTDPRFRGVSKQQRKVQIDKRFQGMFKDDKFKVKYTVDKYGRPVHKTNAEDLRKFYELDSDETTTDDEVKEKPVVKPVDKAVVKPVIRPVTWAGTWAATKPVVKPVIKPVVKPVSASTTSEDKERRAEELAIIRDEQGKHALQLDSSDDDTAGPQTLRSQLTNPNIDYARGEGRPMTDSSSDEETSDDEDGPELNIDHVWGELDVDAGLTEISTRRLAICNMDWDRIRAQDIMVLLSSFLPPGGIILSVKIYPSEYGRARMAEEDVHGPMELVNSKPSLESESDSDEELVREQDSDAEEGDSYHMEKLRQYQLNRLRYYYAVVECDSAGTADKIYNECDGLEYESSANRIDLRFIPDDTSFEGDMPTDECHDLPEASTYQPRQFTTTALQQAKVDLTWDETALDRRELGDKLSSGKVDQLNDKELRKIIAYSSEEDELSDDDKAKFEKLKPVADGKPANRSKQKERIDKYKNLLAEINAKEKDAKNKNTYMQLSLSPEEPMQAAVPKPIVHDLKKQNEKKAISKEQFTRNQPSDDSDDSLTDDIGNKKIPNGNSEQLSKMRKAHRRHQQLNSDSDISEKPTTSKIATAEIKQNIPKTDVDIKGKLQSKVQDPKAKPQKNFSVNKFLRDERDILNGSKRSKYIDRHQHELDRLYFIYVNGIDSDADLGTVVTDKNANRRNSQSRPKVDLTGKSKQEVGIEIYKKKLAEAQSAGAKGKEQAYEMEMSWTISKTEPLIVPKEEPQTSKSNLTPMELLLQKRNERNKLRKDRRRRKKLELLGVDPDAVIETDDDSIPDGIDMNDAYFAEEFANGDYEKPKTTKHKKHKKDKRHKKSRGHDQEVAEALSKAELELLLDDDDDLAQGSSGAKTNKHFSLANILKKELESSISKQKRRRQLKRSKKDGNKLDQDDGFQLNVADDRFKAIYKSHYYNIDPSSSNYKPTKGMSQLINEKLKIRSQQQDARVVDEEPAQKRSKQQLEQNALVKSIKRKLQERKS